MILSRTININDIRIELSEYGNPTGTKEWFAFLHASDIRKSFREQMADITASLQCLFEEYMNDTTCIKARCHVSDAANQTNAIEKELKDIIAGTITIVQQPPLDGTKIALGIYAVDNTGRVSSYNGHTEMEHNGYIHLWTTAKGKSDTDTYNQTTAMFEDYCNHIATKGMNIKDNCMRTWLYVNDIDNNYTDVVRGRNDVFDKKGLTEETHFIASTGIAGYSGIKGTNVVLETYSVKGLLPEQIRFLYATSHMNRTSDYGVRFERGVSITYGDRTQAFISGTASINNKGKILYTGDIQKQTERMWENVGQLLKETDMTLDDDVMQMTIYLRDMADYTVTKELFDKRFPHTPKLILHAPVCRPGWLIEMECICIKDNQCTFNVF